jgi:AAA+ ATPase superfamily predicted ATPase
MFRHLFDWVEILVVASLFIAWGIASGIAWGIVTWGIVAQNIFGITARQPFAKGRGITWRPFAKGTALKNIALFNMMLMLIIVPLCIMFFTVVVDIFTDDLLMNIVLSSASGFAFGIALGIMFGIILGSDLSRGFSNLKPYIAFGIALGIMFGIILGFERSSAIGFVFGIAFVFSYFRIFYILPHMIQYLRAKFFEHEPFSLFRNSPIYWDEVIMTPLPFLSKFLVTLTKTNRKEGLSEIEFVSSKRPTQRKAASSALAETTINDLSRFESIDEIADASNNLSFLSTSESTLSKEFSNVVRKIDDISTDAKSFIDSSSNYNRLRNLNVLRSDVDKFKRTLIATKGPVGYKILPVAEKWSQIIKKETNKLTERKKDAYEEIPNPYIFGSPIRPGDKSRLFVGRLDIIREIESNLSNISQKPTLFLYGRRRVGKSSVLINLPRFLGSQYVSAYIDCQDPRTRESHASFCYTLSKKISVSSNKRGFSIEYPPLESFQKNPFTTLGNWFDKIEKASLSANTLILLALDEYEKLEESILSEDLSIEILDQLRNIIQHRKHFVVLITGSKELSELELNWSDYLISAKTIKLGYLSKDEARILITNPIDDFSLNYEGGENGEVVNKIIDVTSCHPYLVQALCFDLVNYLNTQHRKEARMEDSKTACK